MDGCPPSLEDDTTNSGHVLCGTQAPLAGVARCISVTTPRPGAGTVEKASGGLRPPRHEPVVRLVERQAAVPDGVERRLEDVRQRWVLDDDNGQVGAARHRVLHAEHHDRFIDYHELE